MKEYKPLIVFLLKFLGSYVLMILLYNWYLQQYLPQNIADPFTAFTSDSTKVGLDILGFETKSYQSQGNPFYRIWMEGQNVSIVNEGCNAVSVMIIFVAFIIAFGTKFKTTILYIFGGLIALFVMNIARIVLLNWIFRYHDDYGKTAHDYLFPAIIYGTIVILWIVWIKFFVIKPKKNEQVA